MTGAIVNAHDDPRWQAFNTVGLQCLCGQRHVGPFPIHMLAPLGWQGPNEYQPDADLRMDGTFISGSYCVYEGRSFAIRMNLPLRIRGAAPAGFLFTVWGAVERPVFETYLAAVQAGNLRNDAQMPVVLVNRLAGYEDTNGLGGVAFQQTDGLPLMLVTRPQAGLEGHSLILEQKDGIGFDRALALMAHYGHEMRKTISGAQS